MVTIQTNLRVGYGWATDRRAVGRKTVRLTVGRLRLQDPRSRQQRIQTTRHRHFTRRQRRRRKHLKTDKVKPSLSPPIPYSFPFSLHSFLLPSTSYPLFYLRAPFLRQPAGLQRVCQAIASLHTKSRLFVSYLPMNSKQRRDETTKKLHKRVSRTRATHSKNKLCHKT